MGPGWVIKISKLSLRDFLPVRVAYRFSILFKYLWASLIEGLTWLPARTENSNFYFELTHNNLADLSSTLSFVFGTEPQVFDEYFQEILHDTDLQDHSGSTTSTPGA